MTGPCCSIRFLLTTLLVVVTNSVTAAESASDSPPLTDVIISSGSDSVRIRLWVTVDGEPIADRFDRTQTLYVERLFQQLDRDNNGRLSPDEAAHAPSPQISLPESVLAGETENVNVAFNFRAVDGNHDGHVTAPELLEFYEYFGDGAIRVHRAESMDASDWQLHGELWARLDGDGDGAISPAELSEAPGLASLDRDGNEVLDASELSTPVREGFNVATANEDTLDYRIRTARPTTTSADLHVTIRFFESGRSPLLPQIDVTHDAGHLVARGADAGRLVWNMGDFSVNVQADCGPLRVLNRTRRVLALEFSGADENGDGIVTSDQRLASFLEETFPLLDADGDRAVTAAEFEEFSGELLSLESQARNSQVTLNINAPRRGLFAALDENHDGRLGRRELLSARERCELLDTDSNGSLEARELRTEIRIVVVRGALTLPYSTDRTPDSGPVWFTRLDRNRDGDVSANEFLGSRDLFLRIDLDGDGLIGLSEALQMESSERVTTDN